MTNWSQLCSQHMRSLLFFSCSHHRTLQIHLPSRWSNPETTLLTGLQQSNVLWICCMFKPTFLACELALEFMVRSSPESNLTTKCGAVWEKGPALQIRKPVIERPCGHCLGKARFIPGVSSVGKTVWPNPARGDMYGKSAWNDVCSSATADHQDSSL